MAEHIEIKESDTHSREIGKKGRLRMIQPELARTNGKSVLWPNEANPNLKKASRADGLKASEASQYELWSKPLGFSTSPNE